MAFHGQERRDEVCNSPLVRAKDAAMGDVYTQGHRLEGRLVYHEMTDESPPVVKSENGQPGLPPAYRPSVCSTQRNAVSLLMNPSTTTSSSSKRAGSTTAVATTTSQRSLNAIVRMDFVCQRDP